MRACASDTPALLTTTSGGAPVGSAVNRSVTACAEVRSAAMAVSLQVGARASISCLVAVRASSARPVMVMWVEPARANCLAMAWARVSLWTARRERAKRGECCLADAFAAPGNENCLALCRACETASGGDKGVDVVLGSLDGLHGDGAL